MWPRFQFLRGLLHDRGRNMGEHAPSQSRPPALEARGLKVLRGGRAVLRSVDLGLQAGECVALQGDNGSGKTTLLKCLVGALRPATGAVSWCGMDCQSTPAARRLVGFLGHETGLYLALTVRENLLFAARMYELDQPDDRVAEQLDLVGLATRADLPVGRLSRGQRQRLALARALIHQPPIVLLDEPFTSLDPASRDSLVQHLGRLRSQGRAILLATHDTDFDPGLIDRWLHLQGGRLASRALVSFGPGGPVVSPGDRIEART